MLDLPTLPLTDIAGFADWVEACALTTPSGIVSHADAADVLHDSGVFDVEWPAEIDDCIAEFVDDIWSECRNRKGHPFEVASDSLKLAVKSWRDVPAFSVLMCNDLLRFYSAQGSHISPDSQRSRLFEKIVEASQRGIFGKSTFRFGWPRERSWPTAVNARIEKLGVSMQLDLERLRGKTRTKDKDRGLDVVSRLDLGDENCGSLFVLTQCALGKNWKKKRGEPALAEWQDIFVWNGHLVRAVAIPWRLQGMSEYRDTYRHFDGLVLDRVRLLCGMPDSHLDEGTKAELRTWCTSIMKRLPRV